VTVLERRITPPEPKRDARLARAIREAEGPAPSAARLELLRARIASGTVAMLERRHERAWWEWTTHWARAEVALAAAALILAAFIGGASTNGRGEVVAEASGAPVDSVVSRALAVGASTEQVMNALVGPANGEWLLGEAVSR
jgi:hypothetical protein